MRVIQRMQPAQMRHVWRAVCKGCGDSTGERPMSTRSTPVRSLLASLALATVSAAASSAEAMVLDFDDIPITDPFFEEPVDSYGGFSWGNTWAIDAQGYGTGTGYENSAVSGANIALNGYGDPATTTSTEAFTFNGAYFTSAFRDDMSLTIEGYREGVLVDSLTTTIDTSATNWVEANFENVDTIRFSTSGGTVVVDSPDFEEGGQFALDNFTFNQAVAPTDVPELSGEGVGPGLLLLAGVWALIADQRARRRLAV
jgi:hypothetical protein